MQINQIEEQTMDTLASQFGLLYFFLELSLLVWTTVTKTHQVDIETEKNRNTNMLKRKPTRIELKDVDEEFTNVVEQFKANDNSNNISTNSLDRSGMTNQSTSDMDRSRDSYFNTPTSSTRRDS